MRRNSNNMDCKEKIIKYIEENGLRMRKKISGGTFFRSAVYDERKAYSLEKIKKFIKEGFLFSKNVGIMILNSIFSVDN